MAPTRASARLLEAAQHAGAKVIAIGDPGQLALGSGWRVARLPWPRARFVASHRGDAPARHPRASRPRRAARRSPRALPRVGAGARPDRRRSPTGIARASEAIGEWAQAAQQRGAHAGGDDRSRQRHARAAQRRSARAFEGSRAARRGALLRPGLDRRRRPRDLPAKRLPAGPRQRHARHRPPRRRRSGSDRDRQPARARAAGRLRRRARRARLRSHRSRHAGGHRGARDRARLTARPHRGLELHRPFARPRDDAASDPRGANASRALRAGSGRAVCLRRTQGAARAGTATYARARFRGPRSRAADSRRARRRSRAHVREATDRGAPTGAGGRAR